MAISLNLFHPNFLSHPKRSKIYPFNPTFPQFYPKKPQISCKISNLNDEDLATDFANEVEKMNTQQLERDKAMEKSRQILFREMCKSCDMNEDEMKRKWECMDEDEKWVFVKGFVSDWGQFFYPLSVGSVKDMVDEYLDEDGSASVSNSLSGFKKLLGF